MWKDVSPDVIDSDDPNYVPTNVQFRKGDLRFTITRVMNENDEHRWNLSWLPHIPNHELKEIELEAAKREATATIRETLKKFTDAVADSGGLIIT